jgi:hypothetical protein
MVAYTERGDSFGIISITKVENKQRILKGSLLDFFFLPCWASNPVL